MEWQVMAQLKSKAKKPVIKSITKTEVTKLLKEKAASSGLAEANIKELQFKPMLGDEIAKLAKTDKAGFKIPYFDLSGKPTSFWRYRLLEPSWSGAGQPPKWYKQLRYIQAKDTTNEPYFPPCLDWEAIAADPDCDLFITEGELKAAAACYRGFATAGLGGVWMFRSAKKGLLLLPQFKPFKFDGRRVFIIYDSDASTNPNVIQAEGALADLLMRLKAEPHIVRLDPSPLGEKQGLDDYLLTNSDEAFEQLVERAKPYAPAKALYELNSEVVYVRDPGSIFILRDMRAMRPSDFTAHAYANRQYPEFTVGENGETKVKLKQTAQEWLKWPGRAEVKRITYAPGQGLFTDDGCVNEWTGWGCVPKKGDVGPWHKLLDLLFSGADAATRTFFERWLAYPLQFPGTKMHTAVNMWGIETGTGKSLVGYTMKRIYGENFVELGEEDIDKDKNSWARNKQFVMGEEISGDGSNKRKQADFIRHIITREQIKIDIKYVPIYWVPDVINWYFTSNHPDGFYLVDQDRRLFVWEVTAAKQPKEFYTGYVDWLKSGGAEALFDYFLNMDLGDMQPSDHAPDTSAKKDMIELGRSDLGAWVSKLKSDPAGTLKTSMGSVPLYTLWSSAELLRAYDPLGGSRLTANGMSRELRRAQVPRAADGAALSTITGSAQLWQIGRRQELTKDQAQALYNKERGLMQPTTVTKNENTKKPAGRNKRNV